MMCNLNDVLVRVPERECLKARSRQTLSVVSGESWP